MAQDTRLPAPAATAAAAAMPAPARTVSAPGARLALTLLIGINLFNYLDRQVLAAVEPNIRAELLGDVSGSEAKFKTGLLASAFLVSYMLISPLFGVLADRMSRWVLIGGGVALWSLASGASGLPWHVWGISAAAAFWFLLATRCFVGIGEAAYAPVAPAMIADLFPVERRGRVIAWFYLAMPVGGALGYSLGAAVTKGAFASWVYPLALPLGYTREEAIHLLSSWHWAFLLVVPPGLLLGAWCFLMRDPPRGQSDAVAVTGKKFSLAAVARLLAIPSYTLNTIGMTGMSFAMGGLAFWMAAFLEQRQVEPLFGVQALDPLAVFGLITALAGLLGTLAGGIAGDLLRPRLGGSYFLVSGIALILGFPMILGVIYLPFPAAWIFVFLGVFCLFFNTGPTNTILANVTHPAVRASGFALNILIIHLFGDVISPPLIGWVSGEGAELDRGFILVSAVMAVSGVAWLIGTRYLAEDTRLAPTRG